MTEQLYVTPSGNTSCPNKPCLTLSELAQNPSNYIVPNTIVNFLPGHHVYASKFFRIENVENITLIGSDRDSKCVIQCKAPAIGFAFRNVTYLRISQLTVLFCGMFAYYNHIEIHGGSYFILAGSTSTVRLKGSSVLFYGDVNMTSAIIATYSNITVYGNNHFPRKMSLEQSSLSIYGDVTFTANLGSAIYATNSTLHFQPSFRIEFARNCGEEGGAVALYDNSRMIVGEQTNISFVGNHADQDGGAILADGSIIDIKGAMVCSDNEASDGGAVALRNGASIVLNANCEILFIRNHAQSYGGALHVTDAIATWFKPDLHDPTSNNKQCFFEPTQVLYPEGDVPSVVFLNNTADYAGGALYGGWVDLCQIRGYTVIGANVFDSMFHFQEASHDLSTVSSNPTRVCVCINGLPACSTTKHKITAYPGETFQIPAVCVGQRFGTVPFAVHARFISTNVSNNLPQMESLQGTQVVGRNCTNLTYTIASSNHFEDMILTVDKFNVPEWTYLNFITDIFHILSKSILLQHTDLHVQILVRPCPLGFVLFNSTCVCHPHLTQNGINCSINSQMVHRKSSMWINATIANGSQDGIIIHKSCPFDYCNPNTIDIDLEEPDKQCEFSRSGILCGACQQNLTLVFGTSRCKQCSSMLVLVWVPIFIVSGMVLVVFLTLLNLTVSVGTINGLIFCANIVRASHATFFPPSTTNSFLSWFIAWINLDLGIETCFYDGMDAYTKTWLQFVFPFYIWTLSSVIIISSHYSSSAAKLSGRNSVQVLATLFLLSYAKLLRIIITALSSTELIYSDGSVRKVWLYDGNVNYLEGKHIPLFMAALLLLVIFLLYTTVIICIPCPQRKSNNYRILTWVRKLKPILDAHAGPYKDEHRYWTGILMLLRVALYLVNALSNPAVSLLATGTAVLCVLVYTSFTGGIYKLLYLNALEFSSYLNLGIVSSATLYSRLTGGNQTALVYTSTTIALAQFITVTVIHVVTRIRSSRLYKNISAPSNVQGNQQPLVARDNRSEGDQAQKNRDNEMRQQVLTFNELREPLLEYCNVEN